MKQYVAQVLLIDKYGHRIEFLCTPDTHTQKIELISRSRSIIEKKIRFIEKQPQSVWLFTDIVPFN